MSNSSKPRVRFLMSGSELMSGDTIDTNSVFLAQSLLTIGIAVDEIVSVGDVHAQLVAQVQRLTLSSDLLIMNGGLGPTQDDLTTEILAQAANTTTYTHNAAEQHILQWCKQRGFAANKANMKQAELPQGSTIFPNAPGSAPAFYLTINHCLVIATPGVPSELKHITQYHLLPFLQAHFTLANIPAWQKVQLLGIGESRLQQIINDEMEGVNDVLEIGFRAGFPTLELKYKPQSGLTSEHHLFVEWETRLLNRVADFVLGKGNFNIAATLVNLLLTKQQTVSCAESCTGGLIASEITRIPGASAVFPGGIVSYANSIKQQLLFVPENTLATYGAVSKETVTAMCQGILQQMHTNYGVAVSGIAGPEGGSDDKPVGTVWIAWGDVKQINTVCLHIQLDRQHFQNLVATICLDLLRRYILQATQPEASYIPAYLARWQL